LVSLTFKNAVSFAQYASAGKNTFTLNTTTGDYSDKLLVTDLSVTDSLLTNASNYGFLFISEEIANNVNNATAAAKAEVCSNAYNSSDSVKLESDVLITEITNVAGETLTPDEGHFFGVGRIAGGSALNDKYVNFIPYVKFADGTVNFGDVQKAEF
jgi:hypothetical protein